MNHATDFNDQPKMSNTSISFGRRSNAGRKKKIRDEDKCLVCGNKSIGLNFSVHTCSPCKAFFRRNATKLGTYDFRCRADGDCPITSDTRRYCNCCRLAKCFRVGMNPKAIRSDNERLERNLLVEHNRQKRAQKRNDDEKSVEIINERIRPSNLLVHCQTYSSVLSSNDHTLLNNIFHLYERICISSTYRKHLTIPVDETLTLQKFINASASIYMCLIYYFKSIPEFSTLPMIAKLSLTKSNLNQICRVHSTFMMKVITPDLDTDSPVFIHLFPKDLYTDIRATATALLPFLHDRILIKLYVIVLMLSTHMNTQYESNQIKDDDENFTRNVLTAQNMYVDLLWRYILSRCSSYQQSVQLLSSLITRTLHSQIVQVELNNFIRTALANQNQQLEPIIKSLWISDKQNYS